MKVTNLTLGLILGFFTVLVLGVAGLVIAGREPDAVLYLAAAVLVPSVVSFVGIKATTDVAKTQKEVKDALDRTRADVETVKVQTNGTNTRLVDIIERNIKGKHAADEPVDEPVDIARIPGAGDGPVI